VREENGLERDDFREYERKWVGTWKQLRSRKICRVWLRSPMIKSEGGY
jgi:hypothetical protein